MTQRPTIICAADAKYYPLLTQAVQSVNDAGLRGRMALSVLDLGLEESQIEALSPLVDAVAKAEWDFDFPGRDCFPAYFKAMTARPSLPRYFPGHDIYMWLDADAWVQDAGAVDIYLDAAAKGQLAVVPEIDRAYSSFYKRPRPYYRTQNFRAYRWAYGWRAADRLARNPILNSGVFALSGDAPHWGMWQDALKQALCRRAVFRDRRGLYAHVSEQTAMNYLVYAMQASATFLPAYCNWFCGKGLPMWDAERRLLVEPHAPHQPLGIVHLAGDGVQNRTFAMPTAAGETIESRLTFDAVRALAAA
ncbi:MAG: hypothetical protein VW268_06525 [Rhodospirillaceae bacterium]